MSLTKDKLTEIYKGLDSDSVEEVENIKTSVYKEKTRRYQCKPRKPIKCKQMTARKLSSPYHSVFTDDFSRCIISGIVCKTHPHHIFDGALKSHSEKWGFIIPLEDCMHIGSKSAIHENKELDLYWKRKCEEYWIETLRKTKEEWIQEFGKWW